MKLEISRFGLPDNPQKERRERNKILRQLLRVLLFFLFVAVGISIWLEAFIRCRVVHIATGNVAIDSAWIGSVASYVGGIVGGLFSGTLAFLGVYYTIRYYKESDIEKERMAHQPFLHVTYGAEGEVLDEYKLGQPSDQKKNEKKFFFTIKNIGNGFATTSVVRTGENFGGMAYEKVITIGKTETIAFVVDSQKLKDGIIFQLMFIDSMHNEYIQTYRIKQTEQRIEIENGYPEFLKRRCL